MHAKYLSEMERVHPSDSQDWRDAFVNNEYKEPIMESIKPLNDATKQLHDITGVKWISDEQRWAAYHPTLGQEFKSAYTEKGENLVEKKFTRHEAIKYRWLMEFQYDRGEALRSESFDYLRDTDLKFILSIIKI